MEGEWHTLHRIEEESNLISLLREYEANTITRNAMRCNNCYDLLNLGRGRFRGARGVAGGRGGGLFYNNLLFFL